MEVAGDRYLLVRLREGLDLTGTNPHWVDQTVLRELSKSSTRHTCGFSVAVHLRDFAGGQGGQLAALAAFAPDQVLIANHLPSS
jgi:hypothetical protein